MAQLKGRCQQEPVDQSKAADGLANWGGRVGRSRRGAWRGAWGGRSGACASLPPVPAPGLLFPPWLLALTLTTAFGAGVCQSQGLGR